MQGFAEIVGRHQELATLRAGFTNRQQPGRPVWQVLTGLGGVGKTSLARAYAQRYQDCYQLIWWVRAEDPEAVAGEFRALLDVLAPQYAELTHDPIQAVHAMLANRTGKWLLVIDNIAEPETLRGLLPAAGNGDVLVTSRAGTWPDRRMALPVAPLAQTYAIDLITALSGDPDQDSAAVLAHELGGLPLALAQAGCYVAHSALDLAGYLALYRYRRVDLHREGRAPDYPDTVATTWQLTFDQLTPLARTLLNLLAWYAPDTIPLDQLLTLDIEHLQLSEPVRRPLRPLLIDPVQRHRAIAELVAYGLLTRAGPSGSVTVHRLVQAVTVDQIADQVSARNHHNAWLTAAATLLDAACPRWPGTRDTTVTTGQRPQALQPHVLVILDHLHPDQRITLNLRYTLVNWIGMAGDSVRACKLAATLVEDSERILGPDHPGTTIVQTALAYWTGKAGDVVSARELAATAVQDTTRVLGPDDRHTLLARTNLARWTGEAGDAVSARQLAAAVHDDAQRILGYDDRYTLVSRANLAHWTGVAGNIAAARELAAAIVRDAQRVLGPDDRYTLATRSDLARWTGEAGDAVRAQELAQTLVEDDERVLGAEHRHTLLARANLARWTGAAGDVVRARELAAAVLEDLVRVYGVDHRDTALARDWLTPWTQQTRQPQQSRQTSGS